MAYELDIILIGIVLYFSIGSSLNRIANALEEIKSELEHIRKKPGMKEEYKQS